MGSIYDAKHYKSWGGLKKRLESLLCDDFQGRISYFLTRYHDMHNAYGRAAVRLDGRELVRFSWTDMYRQEADVSELWRGKGQADWNDPALKEKWDADGTFCEMDFLRAAAGFIDLPISEALGSEDYIIRIFAILDRRIGKRTLDAIREKGEYLTWPDWVKQFYLLRLGERTVNVDCRP
ncbi:MAG: hypothetical protein IJL26_09400 [Clostridia bacterium]|nr:hypothetical protein [Clostridia bacterium]